MERLCKLLYGEAVRTSLFPVQGHAWSPTKIKSFCGSYQWKGVSIRKGGKREYMVDVFCIHIILENSRMKPVEIVLRREGVGNRENDGGGKFN
jgi:hypothetical protein